MNKNVKTILMVGGVAIVGYWLWKKYGKGMTSMTTSKGKGESNFVANEEGFLNVNGRARRTASGCTGDGCMQMCSDGCEGGYCMVPQYNERGQITGYLQARCGGTYGSGVLVGTNKGGK